MKVKRIATSGIGAPDPRGDLRRIRRPGRRNAATGPLVVGGGVPRVERADLQSSVPAVRFAKARDSRNTP